MSEQRLVDLAVLSIEKELACGLSSDKIIDKFAKEDKNSWLFSLLRKNLHVVFHLTIIDKFTTEDKNRRIILS